jgi:hypothetical protein
MPKLPTWFVPPIVVPVFLAVLIAVFAACDAFMSAV